MAVTDGNDFRRLVQDGFRDVFVHFGLTELGVEAGRAYAELTAANSVRYLTVGIDRAQDYRIYAKVGKVDGSGRRRPRVAHASSAHDITEFDMEFVLAQPRGAHEGAQEELGRYGSGRTEELRSAISDVADAVYHYGAPVLSGTDDEWDRLANLMMSR